MEGCRAYPLALSTVSLGADTSLVLRILWALLLEAWNLIRRSTALNYKDWGEEMLTKCANPVCSETFRYLNSGRLFRLENDDVDSASGISTPQYFWLCATCARRMTLRLSGCGIKVVQTRETMLGDRDSLAFFPVDRNNGLLLNGANFGSPRVRRRRRRTPGEHYHI